VKPWLALRPVLAILAVTTTALLLLSALISIGQASTLIPPPEGGATQFISARGAHRVTGARGQLSASLKEQVKEVQLLSLIRAIETSPLKGIKDAHEISSQEQGEQAIAHVKVKFGDHSEKIIEFPLEKENGLWKVASLAPLQALPKEPDQ